MTADQWAYERFHGKNECPDLLMSFIYANGHLPLCSDVVLYFCYAYAQAVLGWVCKNKNYKIDPLDKEWFRLNPW